MVLADMSKLDAMIAKQKERLDERPEAPPERPTGAFPWTHKMSDAFDEEIMKSEKCRACNWMNSGQKIILVNRITVMRESLPVVSVICRQCGSVFVPKWCRKIMLQAIEEENKIMKLRMATAKQKEVRDAGEKIAKDALEE